MQAVSSFLIDLFDRGLLFDLIQLKTLQARNYGIGSG